MLNLITPEVMANIEIAVWAVIGLGCLSIVKFATK
jgi:hypothetical protein